MIASTASIDDILRDVRRTLKTATFRGAPFQEDAVAYLGEAQERIDEIGVRYAEIGEDFETVRLELMQEDERVNDLIRLEKDGLWNLVGRPRRDRIFQQIFVGGSTGYTKLTPRNKPRGIGRLVSMLETMPHPRIPPEEVQRVVAALRAASATLVEIRDRLDEIQTEYRLVGAQRAAAARYGRIQLSNLKRQWLARGMTEADVHTIIPDRGKATPAESSVDDDALDVPLAAAK